MTLIKTAADTVLIKVFDFDFSILPANQVLHPFPLPLTTTHNIAFN